MSKPDYSADYSASRLDHRTLEKYEGIWLGIAVVMSLLLFTGVIASMISGTFPLLADKGGTHAMVAASGRIDPTKLADTPFGKPGLVVDAAGKPVVNADGNLEAFIVARAFNFEPTVLRVPAGKPILIHVTSPDVIHGFEVTGTNINAEILPGHVATYKVTFRTPGEQHVICNEYCGSGHQNMITKFIVDPEEK